MFVCATGSTRRLLGSCLLFAGCDGPQSALSPAGRDAATVANLFWWMAGGALILWILVVALSVYAVFTRRTLTRERGQRFIIVAGAVIPVVVLSTLLVLGLRGMPELLAHGEPDGPQIHVSGKQWWWRVRYDLPDGRSFALANEIRLPVGHRTSLWLGTEDVIHSFWVPSLGGKVDMIPGRTNRLGLEPTRTGTFRGACAEYCGLSHARMTIAVVVLEPEAFADWLEEQLAPAAPPTSPEAARGQQLFATHGCGACHTVRGTAADGVIGPDLTHVGTRTFVADVTIDNTVDGFARWLSRPDHIKPGARMPRFDMLSSADLHDLATYLEGLR